jgi:hypothetical protein
VFARVVSAVGDRLPVGHKLKLLCRSCGVSLSDEAFALSFGKFGGTGAMCDLESFLRFVCEHDTTPAALAQQQRATKQQQRRRAVFGGLGGSPASGGGSGSPASSGGGSGAGSPLKVGKRVRAAPASGRRGGGFICMTEFCSMIDGPEGEEAEPVPSDAARALFRKCGASDETGMLDRKAFVHAAAMDEQRRERARLQPLEA